MAFRTGFCVGLVVFSFFSCIDAQQCAGFNPNARVNYEDGKSKSSGTGGLSWLSRFQLPVPNSAYNSTQVALDTLEQNSFINLLWDIEWWIGQLCGWTQKEITNLENGYIGDNNTIVGVPVYIEQDLNSWAQSFAFIGNKSYASYGTWLMKQANKTHDVQGELQLQQRNITDKTQRAYYRIIGDYMGTGIDVSCKSYINATLSAADEFDKAGSNAATTLMALIPVLLTFGNLFVPRSSEVFATSFLVGIMSAVFSLGLPVRSISGVRTKQQVNVSSFEYFGRQSISYFGKHATRQLDGQKRAAANPVSLQELQRWSKCAPKSASPELTREQEASDCTFGGIKRRASKWQGRAHLWHIPAVVVAAVQLVLFLLTIGPLFLGFGTPLLLFDCRNYWTSLWLIVSAAISAVSRFIMWERGAHERVKIYALSKHSITSLRAFVRDTITYTRHGGMDMMCNTTETELPPLYPPMLNLVGHALYRSYRLALRKFHKLSGRPKTPSWPPGFPDLGKGAYQEVSRSQQSVYVGLESGGIVAQLKSAAYLFWTSIYSNITSPVKFVQAGTSRSGRHFRSSTSTTNATRFRPLLLLMHLSTTGRKPLVTLFTGLVEGIILVVLTIFFGAQWGGNLLVLCYVMAILLLAVTFGRALGLWYVWHSGRVYGLHIVECETPRQIIGCLRILCSMTEVLVFVNGAWYFEGHRLDEREGFADWRLKYERGDYDDDEDWKSRRPSIPGPDSDPRHRHHSFVSPEPPRLRFSSETGPESNTTTRLTSPIGSLSLHKQVSVSSESLTRPARSVSQSSRRTDDLTQEVPPPTNPRPRYLQRGLTDSSVLPMLPLSQRVSIPPRKPLPPH